MTQVLPLLSPQMSCEAPFFATLNVSPISRRHGPNGPENTTLKLSPSNDHYDVGSTITMSSSADSRPEAQIEWYQNGSKLPDTGSELTLINIQIGDSGEYSCQAFNTKTLMSETSLPVSVSVRGVSERADGGLSAGAIAGIIIVNITHVRLYFLILPSYHILVLILDCAQGLFRSVKETTSFSARLTDTLDDMDKAVTGVILLGVISGLTNGAGLLPDTMMAAEGGTVNFTTVSPPDGPFITITWLFGAKTIIVATPGSGTPAPDYEGRVTIFPDTGSLELRNLTLNDSGVYTVRILTTAAEHEGTTTLEVVECVSGVTASANSTDLLESSSVRLSCSVSSGSSLTFLWRNGSSEVTAGDRVQLTDEGATLTITNVTHYDEATYTCHVSNPFSSGTSNGVKLSVSYGPENTTLKLSPSNDHYDVGSTITMSCSADSRPEAQFEWYQNGSKLPDTGSELTLINIQIGDSGEYSCQAFNTKTLMSETSLPVSVSVRGVSERADGGLSAGAIAGIVIACLIVVSAAAAGGYILYKKNGSKPQPNVTELQPHIYENPHPVYENVKPQQPRKN
ncbi:carcinoembryonic antigen-related cell adhesion molecule 16-like [Cheilinus undulatus]|uniref:carcinoembryonic antigen-related cell adhesion molecule 16-like n=1 Tax=Cheilinus undulatus TaxID=241271 RepID=UPI001BD4AD59|nr:carcinoembryonic antigen-related cell adhesion molecule 16-like [Cheilinus undulatus]